MGKLDKYVCDGQIDIFNFLQQDIAPEPKPQKKIYEPECCESCIHHIYGGGCELKSKPDHDLCKDWMLDNRPAWMGFLLPQEAIKVLFLSDLIYESIKEQLEKIYSKDGNQEERIEKISSLKGLCGQAYYLSGNQLEELEPYHHHIIGYASNHTYGITIKQMDAEGNQLEFGRYLSWQEVDDALKDLYSDKLVAGKWVKEHGKRILFDDIQEGKYYIADYSTASHDWFKVVYVKEKVDDALHYVDAPKGVRGYWTWGSNYSALTRKQWVDGEDRKQGWWYEVENICQHSQHSCNKEELWKVADSLETECPHTCCRSCKVRMCGARCNGSTEPKEKANRYPNCSEAEIKYILPILRIDACDYMRERIYKDIKGGMPDEQLCKLLKYCYRDWRREKGVEYEHIFHFSKDMRYQSAITYPDGMELRRKPGDTHGCNVMPWSHVLLLIKDMIAAGDYVEVPQVKTKPTLMPGYTCEHDHKCWCNRYGNELPMEEYKTELIKGYSCAGCCYYCKESPIHGGKCKWDCRLRKQ